MATGVRDRYHIALNRKGFMLRGTPSTPRYVKEQAPTLVNQLSTGDLDYNRLNGAGWSYWSQTDWSGGFQRLQWKDDATFKDGRAIETTKKFGEITLQAKRNIAGTITGGRQLTSWNNYENRLFLGTTKNAAANIHFVSAGHSFGLITGYSLISAVNALETYKGQTLIGLTRQTAASAGVKTLATYNNYAVSGIRAANPIVRSIKTIGTRAYTGERVTATSGDMLYYTTNLSTFTSAYFAGRDKKISKIDEVNGVPYFFVENGKQVQMMLYDETNSQTLSVYTFEDLTNWGTRNFIYKLIITGTSDGKRVAYSFDGTEMKQIFDDQLEDSSYDFSKPFIHKNELHVKGAKYDGNYWFPGMYLTFANVVGKPFTSFNNEPYSYLYSAVSGTTDIAYLKVSGSYEPSGYVISSEFGHQIAGVDKFVNSVSMNFKALTSAQKIELYHSTNGGSSFTLRGSASYAVDGAVSNKIIAIPSGMTTKLWNWKAILYGPTTTTPTLTSVTHEYRPMPDMKKRWSFSVDAGDNVQLLNRQFEQRNGRALISDLWLEKEAKRTVIFEDVDAFEVSLVSAMSSTATSARVKDTRLMPPRGRMRVVKSGVVEEMIYTSADGGRIRGITRAQKGTPAGTYTSADKIDNFYTVLVTNLNEQVNNTDQNKTESVAQVTVLEV